MNIIAALVLREESRNINMRKLYEGEIDALPRGTITKKRVGANEYYYLKYRKGDKTVTDYLGKDTEKMEQIRQQLQKRKHYEEMLSELNKEHAIIKRVLEKIQ